MSLARKRMLNEILASVGITNPDVNIDALEIRMEEVLVNYNLTRLSELEMEEDIKEKIVMFISAMKIEGLAQETLYGYHLELSQFARHCPKALALVTTNDIRSFLSTCDEVMLSTMAKKLSSIKSFFSWLVREEILIRDPSVRIKTPKLPKRLKKSLTIEELEMVRESCTSLRERALIETMYSTGCRLSEIAGMKISGINHQDFSMSVIGKGDKERIVYLSFKAMYHLNKYLKSRRDTCDYIFSTSRRPARQMSNAAIAKEINNIEQRAELKKPLTPHILRHTFAQLAMDAGIELSDLQHLMGHSSPAVTLTYATSSEERKKQAYKRFHVQ